MGTETVSILDRLRANAEKHPDRLLYSFLDIQGRVTESYTYAEFVQRTADIAAHLRRAHRFEVGDRVLLAYPPGLELICAFFACLRIGVIPVPVYPPSSHGFEAAAYKMSFIAEDCSATAVLTDRKYLWAMKLNRLKSRITTVSFSSDYTSRLKWIVTTEAQKGSAGAFTSAHTDIAFLQYTSGSTSEPKGVIVTHENLDKNCDAVVDHLPIAVSWLPQYHDMGLIGYYIYAGLKGGTTYGFSPMDFLQRPALWFETISKYRASASSGPNFAYEYCLRPDKVPTEALKGVDLSSLVWLMNAAEPVRPRVFRAFLKAFEPYGLNPKSFFSAYGLAEHTLAVSNYGRVIHAFDSEQLASHQARVTRDDAPPSDATTLVSCGAAIGDSRIQIVDITGTPRVVPDGHVGEIWLSGASNCAGYWNRPELTKAIFQARAEGEPKDGGPWLRTGDLGFVRDGELFICGRSKDLIIIRGLNYYPQDVETIVEEDLAIRKGCVAAFSVERDGRESLVVVAELKDPKRPPDAAIINASIQRRLGISADTFVYIQSRAIPKTSSGKIRRHRARELWLERKLEVLAHVELGASDEPFATSSTLVEGTRGDGKLMSMELIFRRYRLSGTETHTLADAGLDSIALAEFASDLQAYLDAHGASEVANEVDLRWLQKISPVELLDIVKSIEGVSSSSRAQFREAFANLHVEHQALDRELMLQDSRLAFDAEALPRTVSTTIGTKGRILLTGGTGFFGPFLLKSVLEQTSDDVHVLVRGESAEQGKERLREAFLSVGASAAAEWERFAHRVVPLCGDLERPNLGLSQTAWTELAELTHTIYHNGAYVNYLHDYASLRAANVGGTNEIVRLALSHRPKVLNHISTTFVFGWASKEALFETDNNADMTLLDFGYSQSKWVSEQLVFDGMRQGLQARIFRPALITPAVTGAGDSADISIRLLAFMLKHGLGTTTQNQISFSPADVVADNIVAIATTDDTLNKTFHVTRDDYASMADITDRMSRFTGQRFDLHSLRDFVPLVIDRCQNDDPLFPLLNFLVRSVDNITAMEFKRYDHRNYREARDRSPHGKPDPALDDVVRGILRSMKRQGAMSERHAGLLAPVAETEM